MNLIAKFENTIGGWLKPLPHLPASGRKWLAENVWWIVLVGLVLAVIGMAMLVMTFVVALPAIFAAATYVSYYGSTAYTGLWMAGLVATFIFLAATIVLTAMAISPLKKQTKKGWDLIFITLLVSGLSTVVNVVINFNILSFVPSLLSGALGLAIGAYFLFEIRSHFKGAKIVAKTK